jgi:hypothetical protein
MGDASAPCPKGFRPKVNATLVVSTGVGVGFITIEASGNIVSSSVPAEPISMGGAYRAAPPTIRAFKLRRPFMRASSSKTCLDREHRRLAGLPW